MKKRNKSLRIVQTITDYSLLTNMLRYKRPEGSLAQELFCKMYIDPIMDYPDVNGNYVMAISDPDSGILPRVMFTAHHDTVHNQGGMQQVFVKDDIATSDSNCLGADCTTGVFLILAMIKAKVPGVYVIFAGEELGCIGSRAMALDNPPWLDNVDHCISFDRKGFGSIITHQLGYRTCSDAFAKSLSTILGDSFVCDTTGAYTDSNEFIGLVSECTNLSVGYFGQHTNKETQDLAFAYSLRDKLISADWSQLVSERVPALDDYVDYDLNWARDYQNAKGVTRKSSVKGMVQLVEDYPEEIADLLEQWGMSFETLREEIEGGVYGPNSGPDQWKDYL